MIGSRPRFHLAVPVDDLDAARTCYGNVPGCPRGRSSADWNRYDGQVFARSGPEVHP